MPRGGAVFFFGREAVELRPLVRVGLAPRPGDPPFLGEPLERGIEGAGFDLQDLERLGADGLADP